MNALKQIVIIALIAASASFVGYRFRLSRRAHAMVSAQTESVARANGKTSTKKRAAELPPASPLVKKLENDIAMSKGVTRWLSWVETLEKAQAADFPRLFDLAANNPELTKLVATRWAEKFPQQFFDTVVARSNEGVRTPWEALDILFSTWGKADAKAMIAALDSGSDFSGRNGWRMQAINTLFKNDVETGLRLMAQWHIENYTPDMKGVEKWAAADPLHAAQYLLQNKAGYVTQAAAKIVASEWTRKDPEAALGFARNSAGTLKETMSRAALTQWADIDLKKAGDWLVGADASTRNQLGPDFVQTWAKSDLPGALEWAQANLSGTVLARSVGNAIRSVANKDPAVAASFVLDMQPSSARAEAALAVAQKWFPDTFTNGGMPPSAEAVQWLSQLDPESTKKALSEVSWRWEDTDVKGLAAFLENAQNDSVPAFVFNNVARNMARKEPLDALNWSGRLPSQFTKEASEYAFREWRQAQPESAADWLAKLPAEDQRRTALLDNTIREWASDPLKTEQLARFAAINEKAAESIYRELPLTDDRRAALLATLPSRKTAQK